MAWRDSELRPSGEHGLVSSLFALACLRKKRPFMVFPEEGATRMYSRRGNFESKEQITYVECISRPLKLI